MDGNSKLALGIPSIIAHLACPDLNEWPRRDAAAAAEQQQTSTLGWLEVKHSADARLVCGNTTKPIFVDILFRNILQKQSYGSFKKFAFSVHLCMVESFTVNTAERRKPPLIMVANLSTW